MSDPPAPLPAGGDPLGPPATRESVAAQVRSLGVSPGQVLLVHASLGALGWVCGGAVAVVQALQDVLGPTGTVAVPTFTADNRDPQRWREDAVPREWWPTVRDHLPAFDPAISPGQRMGAISEQVRTWPGARRSAHPQTSFAALGPQAERVVAGHELACHLGEQSPLRRLEELDAQVLLLGVDWNRCTAFHLAEYRRPEPPRRRYTAVVGGPSGRRWVSYQDVTLDDGDFQQLGLAFEEDCGATPGLLARGPVGRARSRRFPLAAAVAFARRWLGTGRATTDGS